MFRRIVQRKIKVTSFRQKCVDIAIFDLVNSAHLQVLFNEYSILSIPARGEFYFCSPTIFFLTVAQIYRHYFSKENRSQLTGFRKIIRFAYYAAVIKVSRCRVVVTFIDNNEFFHELSHFYNAIPFITFQNGSRNIFGVKGGRLNVRNFFCFGQYEVDLYRSLGQTVDNYVLLGLLPTLQFLCRPQAPMTEEFSLFFPSQFHQEIQFGDAMPWEKQGQTALLNLLKEYLRIDADLTLLIGLRSDLPIEREFYRSFFENNLRVHFSDRSLGDYSSYFAARRCSVVVGFSSTLVEEAMSWGQKALYLNVTDNPDCSFENSHWNLCGAQALSISDGILKIQRLLSMNCQEYRSLSAIERNYMMKTNDPENRLAALAHFVRDLIGQGHQISINQIYAKYFDADQQGVWSVRT